MGTRTSVQLLRRQSVTVKAVTESRFGDGTCSLVVIVKGMNKCVTEMTEETQENHIDENGDSTGKLVAEARSKLNINADDFFSNGYITISPAWLD